MARKDRLDMTGAVLLIGISLVLGFNQIAVKWVNAGLQPVFFAGLRSTLAIFFVWGWLAYKGRPPRLPRALWGAGALIGVSFAFEFLFLFIALDLTTVSRASIIFYSMPVWLALMAHFGLPGERITASKAAGLLLAFVGTALAIVLGASGGQSGRGSVVGDLCALAGAVSWAGSAFLARRPGLAAIGPEMQLFWMVLVSGPVLIVISPFFGPLLRDLEPLHLVALVAQAAIIVSGVFVLWLWMLATYPAATVASFSFLTPVFGVILGIAIYAEPLTPGIAVAGGACCGRHHPDQQTIKSDGWSQGCHTRCCDRPRCAPPITVGFHQARCQPRLASPWRDNNFVALSRKHPPHRPHGARLH